MIAREADVTLDAAAERGERTTRQKAPSRKMGVQLDAVGVAIVALNMGLFGCSSNDRADGNAPAGDTSTGGAGSSVTPPSSPQGGGGSGVAGAVGTGVAGSSFGASGATATSAGGVPSSGGGGASGGIAVTAGSGGVGGVAGSGGTAGNAAAGGGGAGMGGGGVVSTGGPLHFGTNIRINDDTGTSPQEEVALATSKDVLVAGWMDGRSTAGGRNGYKCGYSVSRDGGMTWSANIFATTQGGSAGGAQSQFAGDPSVAADDAGNLYLASQDYGAGKILFASSADQGMTFTPFAGVQSEIDKPWISAARDGTVFMTWLGYPGGFKRSLDHGKTWDPVISLGNLSAGTGIASGSNGYVHIPFATDDGKLRYVRSKDWGQTLEAPRDLDSVGTQQCTSCEPRDEKVVACATDPSGQTVVISWGSVLSGGDGNDDVWALISKDAGETWSKRLRVNDNQQASRQFQPWAAVDTTGRVHVAWTDLRNGGMNSIYYASALDPAMGFGPNVEVTDKRGPANTFLGDFKGVVVQGPYVIVAWTDTRNGNPDVYVARAKLDGSSP